MGISASPEHETARLAALSRYQILDTPSERSFDEKVRLVAYILGVPIALLTFIDAQRGWFKAKLGCECSEVAREQLFGTHLDAAEALCLSDARKDPRFAAHPMVVGPPGLRFYVGVPITTPEGLVIGALSGLDRQPRSLPPHGLESLRLLAAQVIEELELRRRNLEIAERAAANTEERATLHAMLEQVPGAVCFWTPELKLGYVNAGYCRLVECEREQVQGMPAEELLGAVAYARAYPHLLGALRGEAQSFENVIFGRRGTRREVHIEYTPFLYGGRVLGVIAHVMDMTARNQATREYMHVQAKQRALLDALPGVALQLGSDGYVSALYGRDDEHPFLRSEDLHGRSLREILSGLQIEHRFEQFEETMRRAHEHQRRQSFEFELSVDGETRSYEARVAPASDLLDTVCLLLDVTRRTQAETRLRASEVFLATVINSAIDGIVILDQRGCILQVNPAMEGLCGYRQAELVQRSIGLLTADLLAATQDSLRDGAKATGKNSLLLNEVAISRKDGAQVFAEISVSTFELGGQIHFSAIVRDIQERQLMRARSEFVSMVSHELRAPLNTVVGLGEAMLEDAAEPLPPRQTERLRTMQASAQHLAEVVKDILDLSRIELGMLRLERGEVAITWLCDLAVAMVADAAERREISLRKDVPGSELVLSVDRRRILQILVNLLDNAIKFTGPGGSVRLAVRVREAVVEFSIDDTGIGIAEADRDRLFRPFSQVESATNRKFQGVGLGLYLAQRLAALHAGHIAVRSTPGVGTCFTLSLPRISIPMESASVCTHPDRG